MERRKFTLKWDNEYQYTDGVPAELIVATPYDLDENEKVKVVEVKEGDVILTKEEAQEIRNAMRVECQDAANLMNAKMGIK